MQFEKFSNLMDAHISEEAKVDLLKTLAKNPERFIGLFRANKPAAKLQQFLLQSREIRFGDALEEVIEYYIREMGYELMPKQIKYTDGSILNVDQLFRDNSFVWFIEQKVRDDHDSTKKRGQVENFAKKAEMLTQKFPGGVKGAMFFIDPSFRKNQRYYVPEIGRLTSHLGLELKLFYGSELFTFFGNSALWSELTSHLKRWKDQLPLHQLPNFDENLAESLHEFRQVEMSLWRKIIGNQSLWSEGIIQALCPLGKSLDAYANELIANQDMMQREIGQTLHTKIKNYY